MAIKLAPVAQVEREVRIDVPREKGGFDTQTIRVTYKLLSVAELRETYETQRDGDDLSDDDLIHRDVLDVRGVKGEDGKDVAFSAELLSALMNTVYIRPEIIRGWQEVQNNRQENAEKN